MCTTFSKRDNRVAEMRMGSMAVTPEYACDKEYFNNTLPFHTIVGKFKIIINCLKHRIKAVPLYFRWRVLSLSVVRKVFCVHEAK